VVLLLMHTDGYWRTISPTKRVPSTKPKEKTKAKFVTVWPYVKIAHQAKDAGLVKKLIFTESLVMLKLKVKKI